MVTSNIFVNAPTTAFYTVKILAKEAKNIVAAIFTFYCEYFVVNLTKAQIKMIEILILIFFSRTKACHSHTSKFYTFFFACKKKKKKKKIKNKYKKKKKKKKKKKFPSKINTF